MDQPGTTTVWGQDGWRASLMRLLPSPDAPAADTGGDRLAELALDDGRRVYVPAERLEPREDGSYFVSLTRTDLVNSSSRLRPDAGPMAPVAPAGSARVTPSDPSVPSPAPADNQTLIVPVMEERMTVERQRVETGRVRITKTVQERHEVVDEPVLQEEVQVERVQINRPVEGPVPIRYEGDTMIVPLLEEVMVVEKRLMLKEEIRITRHQFQTHKPQDVMLRTEQATIERVPPPGAEGGHTPETADLIYDPPPDQSPTA